MTTVFMFVARNFILVMLALAAFGGVMIAAGFTNAAVALVHGAFAILGVLLTICDRRLDAKAVGVLVALFFGLSAYLHASGVL